MVQLYAKPKALEGYNLKEGSVPFLFHSESQRLPKLKGEQDRPVFDGTVADGAVEHNKSRTQGRG